MLTIFRDIVRACYDRVFYKESENHSFGRRYGRLYVLFMLVSLFFVGSLVTFYMQNRTKVESLPQTLTQSLSTFYPKELVLKFNKNELSINQPEPYYVGEDLFGDAQDSAQDTSNPQALLVIDTKADISDFDTYGAYILAMKKGIAARQSDNREVRFYSYADMLKEVPQPLTFDYISYNQIVNKLRPFIKLIPTYVIYALVVGAIFIILLAPFFLVSGVLFNLLFLSLLGYFAGLIIKRKHTYGYVYKLGMYAAIPVVILQQATTLMRVPYLESIWWMVALLLMVIFMPPALEDKSAVQVSSPMDPPKVT